jgi:hypothetical protein
MADITFLQVPVEVGLELCAIVRLNHEHSEGKASDDLIHEADSCLLVAGIVDLEHTDARAVIDCRELIETSLRARDSLEEFHVDLQTVSGLWLLVSIPRAPCRLSLLIGRQAVHSITDQYPMHCGTCHVHVVEAMQVAGDASRTEPVALSQIQDLRNN